MNPDPLNYYRLPWNCADKAISWLEPTTMSDLRCGGCRWILTVRGELPLEELRMCGDFITVVPKLRFSRNFQGKSSRCS